jgi:hypothetical protein
MRSDAAYAVDLGYSLLGVADEIEKVSARPEPDLKARAEWCALMLWAINDIERQFEQVAGAVVRRRTLPRHLAELASECRRHVLGMMPVASRAVN